MKKKQYENKFWEGASQTRIKDGDFEEVKREVKMHHKVFTKKSGVTTTLHYLTSQDKNIENWLRQNSDPAITHAGSKERNLLFGRSLKYRLLKKFNKVRDELDKQTKEGNQQDRAAWSKK